MTKYREKQDNSVLQIRLCGRLLTENCDDAICDSLLLIAWRLTMKKKLSREFRSEDL